MYDTGTGRTMSHAVALPVHLNCISSVLSGYALFAMNAVGNLTANTGICTSSSQVPILLKVSVSKSKHLISVS